MSQSGDLDFNPPDNSWSYRLFLLISVAWFAVPAWLGPFGAILTDALNNPLLARLTSRWVWVDQWLVVPQVRLLEFITPPLAERWPITDGLTNPHRIMFSVFYAVLGWVCVRLVSSQYQVWWLRVWWIIIYWAACLAFFQVTALLLLHFGIISRG